MKTIVAIFLIAFSVNSFAQEKKTEAELLNFVNDSLVVNGRIQSSKFLQLMRDLNTSKEDSTWIDGFVKGLGYVATLANTTELNIMDGALVSTSELNRLVGVTANIQTQLDAKVDTSLIDTAAYYTASEVDSIKNVVPNLLTSDLRAFGSDIIAMPIGTAKLGSSTANLSDGRGYAFAFRLIDSTEVTGVKWLHRTAGDYTADNYNGFKLYEIDVESRTYTRLDSTANDGDIWKQSDYTLGTKDFTNGATVYPPGLYYVGMIYNSSAETTPPALYANDSQSSLISLLINSNRISLSISPLTDLPVTFVYNTANSTTHSGPWSIFLY